MKKKIILITTLLVLITLTSTSIHTEAAITYDMLIITPTEFLEEVEPLETFKDFTNRPTVVVTLDDIYDYYTGADKAEQVKKCIADYEENYNIKYVLLMGDVDKVPIRYFLVQTYNPSEPGEEIQWFAYYMTDQYYADLYDDLGVFCDWNGDGDDYYAETYRTEPDYDISNIDDVNFEWDVTVGRVPASTEAEVTNYVNKVIDYELNTYTTDAWFKKLLLVSGIGGSIYPDEPDYDDPDDGPPYYDLQKLDSYGDILEAAGYTTTKLYHYGGDNFPDPTLINNELNSGVGFFTVYSHQNQGSFGGGVYAFPNDMNGLANSGTLPIIFSLGCSPAKTGPIGPNEDYLDITGAHQDYNFAYPEDEATWTDPMPPNVLQSTTDQGAVPDYLLVEYPNRGSIAFIGSMAEALPSITEPCSLAFHQSIAGGETVLGEVWKDVGDTIVANYPVDSQWEYCRRWLFMGLFGDPSLRIGGLPDKDFPITTIEVGQFNYDDGETLYIKGGAQFTISSDTPDFSKAYYQVYPTTDPHNVWQAGTTFYLEGIAGDVEYTINYYGEDTSGNREFPINTLTVTVDNTPMDATHTIGSPKYEHDIYTFITSQTHITLSATDTGSGENIIYYSVNPAHPDPPTPFEEYPGPITITGDDGAYTLDYYGYDKVYNMFNKPTVNLALDNSGPTLSIDIEGPQYEKASELWVTSETIFSVESNDFGSGLDRVQYTLYDDTPGREREVSSDTYETPFTLPINSNNNAVKWRIEFKAYDNLGNIETETVIVWLEDRAPDPILAWDYCYFVYGEEYFYISSATTFEFNPIDDDAYDRGVGVDYTEYTINGEEPWTRYNPGDTFHLTGPDGVYTIEAYSIDYLGNTKEPGTQTFYLDNNTPETELTLVGPIYSLSGNTWITSATTINLNGVDEASGVSITKYRINGEPYNEYNEPFTITGIDGLYTIDYYSEDNIGNIETTKTATFYLDNTTPETTLFIGDPKQGNIITQNTPLTLTPDDPGTDPSEVDYTLYSWDANNWLTYQGQFYCPTTGDGEYQLSYYCVDNLGNTETAHQVTLVLDDTPPTVNVESPLDHAYVYDMITIEITAIDTGSGVETVQYTLDDGTNWYTATYDTINDIYLANVDTSLNPEGVLTINARAWDKVGNLGEDSNPPEITVLYLEYSIRFTDGDKNPLKDFKVAFSEQKPGTYKLNTDPGNLCEIIAITNTGSKSVLPELIIDVELPVETSFLGYGEEAFAYKGAKSIHVYLNGEEVTPDGKWLPELSNVDVEKELRPGDKIEICIHYNYAFKGNVYSDPDVSTWRGEDYIFITHISSATGSSWSNLIPAIPLLR